MAMLEDTYVPSLYVALRIVKINLPCTPMSEIFFGLKRKDCEADNNTSRQKEGLQDNGYVVERDKDSDGIRLNNSLECKIIYL